MDILITKKNTQVTTPETVNFTALLAHSDINSLPLQSRFIELLNEEFTEEELKLYIANLYMYLNYDSTTDYPINLETVYKMIGFANKGNAMKTIKSNFTKDEDYKTIIFPMEKNKLTKETRGRKEETIMLNVDTFKSLCMLVKTPEGKKIRKYYIKLENVNNKITKEQLENKDKLLEEKEIELQQTQEQLKKVSKLKVKKWYNTPPGNIVYAYKNNESDTLITIGKSKNLAHREMNYMTHNQNGEIIYVKKCHNSYLVEKVIHHILDKHRIHNNKEWFAISNELAIYTIDIVCNFLDNIIIYSEKLPSSNIKENFIHSIELMKNLSPQDQNNQEIIQYNKQKNIEHKKEDIKIKDTKNLCDFEKFFTDKCEIGKDYYCSTYDIYGAYRLWANDVKIEYKLKLTEYLNDNYKKIRKYFNNIKSSMTVFVGFKVKPFILVQENLQILPKYEEFILTQCEFGYNYKTSVESFMYEFNNWIKDYPEYNIKDERQFKSYINRHFLKTNLKIDNQDCNGIWGLKLKNCNQMMYINHKSQSKEIIKIDIFTNDIIQKYDSIIMLSNTLQVSKEKIHKYIKNKVIFDEKYFYKFKHIIEK